MKPGWNIPEQTRQRQARAADPGLSAWVSANAGSGKTHVLVNRVLRLLLDGVKPGRMLCITYTKAAAANMANRIFKALGTWATLEEAALAKELTELTGRAPTAAERAKARRLFAEALETPGGLRIETIHAFCTRVLQAAPFEANVPPRFEVADDLAQAEMLREARRELLGLVAADPQGPEAQALDLLAQLAAQDSFESMVQEALRQRALFSDENGRARDAAEMKAGIAAFLGIASDLAPDTVKAGFRADFAALPGLQALIEALQAGSDTRQKFAARLRTLLAGQDDGDPVAFARVGFITGEGTINSNVRGRGGSAFDGGLLDTLEALGDCVLAAADQLNAVAIRDRSAALALLVTRMLASYQRQKSLRSLLDYDDLIARTRSLLERVEAAWVLYKLDAGIDHILLDEAQDTGEAQWAILRKLAEEFTSGRDLGMKPRTIFVVGDEKQSIYGFQGAAPAAFGAERHALGQRIRGAELSFEAISLNTSFRSAPDIMQAVDAVFAVREHARGLVFDGAERPEVHATVRDAAPGTVDIWPVSVNDTGEPPDAWTTPVDAPERRSGTVKLAERIANTLRRWHQAGRDDLGNPFAAGDVMILLRQRGALFEAIVKALKDAGVPVAGRDRLTLAEHPAVEDLVVLGRALLLPDDDLTLATALKTPLIDLNDDDLLRLAPGREGSLRAALQEAAASEPRYGAAEAKLAGWAREAGRSGPFRFFAGLLGPGGGRNLALARLGAEAGDALDAFLNAALDHERRYGPSLAGFLQHVAGSAADVKRDLSASAGEVRVMTVHGSKGLEARIVILADLGPQPGAKRLPKILAVPVKGELVPIWPPASAEDTDATTGAKGRVVEQMVEEHHRLLYVAMTRAEDRLIVCGVQAKGEVPEGSWYAMIEQGLAQSQSGLREIGEGEDAIRRFMVTPPAPHEAPEPKATMPIPAPPAWLTRQVAREAEPAPPLKPSSALSAADAEERPGDGPFLAEAASAGRLAHLLLQLLPDVPAERRAATADALAQARGGALRSERRDVIVADALRLLAAPGLADLFGENALAEVPVAGLIALPDGTRRPVSGRIDRLAVTHDSVVIADFKTTARPPVDAGAIPPATLAQLAAYAALMREIYPGRAVRALAVYTASLAHFELADERLDAALAGLAAASGGGAYGAPGP
ncbi:double-strand break repair helicase AddA [Bosea sp. BH3]|uniref:double-strand break repair helicase AddA n=1 Tax=Bosea sp. BH3 TaxID=2871701 RepID=UPI0021CB0ACA|nr:double-strand break repair helicase AddA [Bosea sp. BH3]MCU4181713.1 double-strand break repair helicase AddA [Bosea sp. BH3]